MITIHQDTIFQYLDGKDLLQVRLTERRRLLQDLGQLVIAHLEVSRPETVIAFPLARAQTLLFELSVFSEYIDALIVEVNSYAERCGKPRVERIDTGPQ